MLENLRSYIEEQSLSDDPFVRLTSISFDSTDANLRIQIQNYQQTEEWSTWSVNVLGLHEYRIIEPSGDLSLVGDDHILVRQHTEVWQQLYFRGVPNPPFEVVAQLWIVHRGMAEGWIPFERYLNPRCKLEDLLAGGHGMVANGPTSLIHAYAKVLESSGVTTSILKSHPAMWWNGERWIENTVSLSALVIGDSFFVAEGFEEQRLPKGTG